MFSPYSVDPPAGPRQMDLRSSSASRAHKQVRQWCTISGGETNDSFVDSGGGVGLRTVCTNLSKRFGSSIHAWAGQFERHKELTPSRPHKVALVIYAPLSSITYQHSQRCKLRKGGVQIVKFASFPVRKGGTLMCDRRAFVDYETTCFDPGSFPASKPTCRC